MPDERWVAVPNKEQGGDDHEIRVKHEGYWWFVAEHGTNKVAENCAERLRKTIREAQAEAAEKAAQPHKETEEEFAEHYRRWFEAQREFFTTPTREFFATPTKEPEMPDGPKVIYGNISVLRFVRFETGNYCWGTTLFEKDELDDPDGKPIMLSDAVNDDSGGQTIHLEIDEAREVAALLTAAVGEAEKGQATKPGPDPRCDEVKELLMDCHEVLKSFAPDSGVGFRGEVLGKVRAFLIKLEAQPLTPDPAD